MYTFIYIRIYTDPYTYTYTYTLELAWHSKPICFSVDLGRAEEGAEVVPIFTKRMQVAKTMYFA